MRISLDVDGVFADNETIQQLAVVLNANPNVELYILTSRDPILDNRDLYKLIKDLNLNIKEVIFACMETKVSKVIKYNIDLHFDDDEIDVKQINYETGKNKAVLVNFNW